MVIVRFFSAVDDDQRQRILHRFQKVNAHVINLRVEKCYHVQNSKYSEFPRDVEKLLRWILKGPQQEDNLSAISTLEKEKENEELVEIGPRFNFSTADSTNSVSICHNVGLKFIDRIEASYRYLISFDSSRFSEKDLPPLMDVVCDRMTQCRYTKANMPQKDFYENFVLSDEKWYTVPVIERGVEALKEVDKKLGTFSKWDEGLECLESIKKNYPKHKPRTVSWGNIDHKAKIDRLNASHEKPF